jgi:hypothetical protein
MASKKQKRAASRNIRKAQAKWRSMSRRQHARAQPQGRGRKKPGTGGKGKYYRVVVRPKSQFSSFRVHDVGRKGHVQRLAGRRRNGSWDTQAWLIAKTDARVSGGALVGKTASAKSVISKLGAKPKKVKGDVFRAKPRKNVPERAKPTAKMKRAQRRNIKKAQAARRKKR